MRHPSNSAWPSWIKDDLVDEARDLVEPLLGPVSWCFKDPRLSLLLPWWRRILLDRFVVVVSVRPAEEIAWSLTLRDGFSRELGRALTASYYRHLASGISGLPVVLVDYVALVARPADVLSELFDGLRSLGVVAPLNLEPAAASIHPTLRRATQPTAAGNGTAMPDSVDRLMETWSVKGTRAAERFSIVAPPPEPWEVRAVTLHRVDLLRERVSAHEQGTDLASELTGLRAAIALAEDERSRDADDQVSLQRRLVNAEAELDQRELELATVRAILSATETERDQRVADELEMRTRWAATEGERERLAGVADRSNAELSAAQARLATALSDRDRLAGVADRLTVELSAVHARLATAETETQRLRAALADLRVQIEDQRHRFVAERQARLIDARKGSAELSAAQDRLTELQSRTNDQIRRLMVEREEAVDRAARLEVLARRRTLKARLIAGVTHLPLPRWLAAYSLFDGTWYRATYPDVASGRTGPYVHWRRHGMAERRDPNPFFDVDWYLNRYPDVASSGMDPAAHYVRFGAREGRDPSPLFDTDWYLAQNPDVEASGHNPLAHYLQHGRFEGRAPRRVLPAAPVVSAAAPRPVPDREPQPGEARAHDNGTFLEDTVAFDVPSRQVAGNGNGNGNGHAPAASDVTADASTA